MVPSLACLLLRCEQEKAFPLRWTNEWENNAVSNNKSGRIILGLKKGGS